MRDCLFCKMVAGEIQTDIVYQDDVIFAFRDINPQAPTHILIIPKQHVANLNELGDIELGGSILQSAINIAKQEGLTNNGYRTVINCNRDGGQEVFHLHLHLLGGRQLTWPPG